MTVIKSVSQRIFTYISLLMTLMTELRDRINNNNKKFSFSETQTTRFGDLPKICIKLPTVIKYPLFSLFRSHLLHRPHLPNLAACPKTTDSLDTGNPVKQLGLSVERWHIR